MRAIPRASDAPRHFGRLLRGCRLAFATLILLLYTHRAIAQAQVDAPPAAVAATTEQKIGQLTAAVTHAQAQVESYQKQLLELRRQLAELQQQVSTEKTALPNTAQAPAADSERASTSGASGTSLEDIRERQALEESQIATHDLSKVETQSKFPLKVTGLLLFNGFVNTRKVDLPAAPSYALPGSGSTGLSLRQTVLGLDARGPHLLDATSHADLRVDFFANATQSNYAASGLLRLRTAHATLDWQNTEAFVELDRTILEPNEPSSLLAIGQPELAWAGNLWNWVPQVGGSRQFALSDSSRIKLQAALIDTSDPMPPGSTSSTSTVTQTERSRWPGTEARISFAGGQDSAGPEIGVGGYFSPHRNDDGESFDAWAATVDVRLPLTSHFELTSNAHRGQALAGLGAGGYINFIYGGTGLAQTIYALDDIGGWAQLKARAGQRVEINTGFGIDNPFSKEIQASTPYSETTPYPGLARNRALYSNVIYSPSAWLLFSVEYKRLWTNYASSPSAFSDIIGIGAGYKF